jgi:hypothetical protein
VTATSLGLRSIDRVRRTRPRRRVYDVLVTDIGKLLLIVGLVLAAVGALLFFAGGRVPLGRLPGDVVWRRGNTTVYFPIVTCIIVSLVVTLILSLVRR